jgi:hypothetical protein
VSLNVQRPIGYEPVEIAPETFLVRAAMAAKGDVQVMYQSSMVIRGAEPILVDTGPAAAADLWLDTAFSLVDPEDVRWVFVSHNDSDHNGNVLAVLAACPNATLVTTSAGVARTTSSFDLPYRRMTWLNFGDTFDAGDRTIEIVDPVVYDSPATQGLFDRSTGAVWAVDAFAAPVPAEGAPAYAHELATEAWERPLAGLGIAANPWLEGVRPEWFAARVEAMTALEPSVVASAHGPAITGDQIGRAAAIYAALPGAPAPRGPGQDDLDALLRAHHH